MSIPLELIASELRQKRDFDDVEASRARCSTLAGFVREAWHVVEPATTYVHGWHIDAICFPFETLITTKDGQKPIGEIVETGWRGSVLAFNHVTGEPEWRRIRARMKSPAKPMVTIKTSTGGSLTSTENHPIFVKGRGYVAAGSVEVGDMLMRLRRVRAGVYPEARDQEEVLLPRLSLRASDVHDTARKVDRVRALWREFLSKPVAPARWVLQYEMLWAIEAASRKSKVPRMWRKEGVCRRAMSRVLRAVAEARRTLRLPTMQYAGVPFAWAFGGEFAQARGFLQSPMLRRVLQGQEQFGIHRRRQSGGISGRVRSNTSSDLGTGITSLLHLPRVRAARRSPHRQGQGQQLAIESRFTMPPLPQSAKGRGKDGDGYSLGESVVVAVERDLRIPDVVYNIEVEAHHNYFADGLLVHNCQHLGAITRGEMLARGLENRLLVNIPPGHMKPVHVDEPVTTRRGVIPLGQVVVGDYVLTHRGRFRIVTSVHQQGVIPTVVVRTMNGRSVRAAPDHPFLTPSGWVNAGDLTDRDYVGFPRRDEDFGDGSMSNAEARLLGYLVGDGSLSTASLSFTNADDDVLDDFERCAAKCGFHARRVVHPNPKVLARRVTIKSSESRVRRGAENRIRDWLSCHGLMFSNSYTKRIPEAVFRSGPRAIENFMGAYWSCDGMIGIRHAGKKTTMISSATTVSEGLAGDVQRALSLLNIDTRIRRRSTRMVTKKQPGGRYVSFDVVTTTRNEVAKFAAMAGLCPRKAESARRAFRDKFDADLFADAVLSVEDGGAEECVCLTVDEDHSFTANGLAVHNSLLIGVLWPAYEWGPAGMPHLRYLTASYAQDYAKRDCRKMRDLVDSEWYRARWGVRLTRFGETSIANDKGGGREAVAFESLTSGRGDRVILDDPNSVKTAESDADRERTNRTFRESLTNRLNDTVRSAIIVVMQRLHTDDVSGVILKFKMPYVHLCLPMRFEPERRCETPLGFRDPRTTEGELLFPERFPPEAVDRDEAIMLDYAVAGQHQQRPAPRGGGMFKKSWFDVVGAAPAGTTWVRGWDLAGTRGKKSPYTVGVKLGFHAGTFYVGDIVRERVAAEDVEALFRNTVHQDGRAVEQDIPQDPGQSGKFQARYLVKQLAGYVVHFSTETGSKPDRAKPVAMQAKAGNVKLVAGPWNDAFLEEASVFPNGSYLDQIDALSRAFERALTLMRNGDDTGDFSAPFAVSI